MKDMYVENHCNIKANKPRYYVTSISGRIDITASVIDGLYIGSGFINQTVEGTLYKESMKAQGQAVIPGSSVKGCVRQIASIVSDGCLIDSKKEYRGSYYFPFENLRCGRNDRCIICDMFGMMGRKSKIVFSDMLSANARYSITELNSQFEPKITGRRYHDQKGKLYGYKLYKTKCESYRLRQRDSVEVIKAGAVFTGYVLFDRLMIDELRLLCFALGLGEDINLKIGGYRNEGIGQIEVRGCITTETGAYDVKKLASEYAKNYGGEGVKAAVEEVRKSLAPYYGGVKR